MSDIATIIIFKKENGEEFIFDDKYVQLTSLENKMLIFRFEAPQDILNGEHLNGIFTLSLQQIVKAPDLEEEHNCQTCALMQDGVCSIKDNSGMTSCDDYK